jgi:pilus assembly protein CpaF
VSARDLVKNALRMRPDRIIVGETRSGEALDMLQAMNTGHEGSMTTVHANTARDAISRLETMCLFSGTQLPTKAVREQIASAVQVVVQVSRQTDGTRRVMSVTEVTGMEGETISAQEIFRYRRMGLSPEGRCSAGSRRRACARCSPRSSRRPASSCRARCSARRDAR